MSPATGYNNVADKHRPLLHFTPAKGWMNDPNGLIAVEGLYHLFFQYDPDSITHGPMHWGHAVSTDLCNWTERPVALYPGPLGTCFSGSAIETATGEVKLFHTAHRKTADGRDWQTQCLVHADRALTRFEGEAGNPVLDNPGLEAFRDPKVIWHAGTARWIMAVTLGHTIGFYSSADLTHWQFESCFGEDEARPGEGVWECPDLLEMIAPDGTTAWVLVVSLASGAYAPGSGTRYYVGSFDGHRFTSANPPLTDLWIDYGRDFYAPQTFYRTDAAKAPIAIGWASNWGYAKQTPTAEFRGAMSLPRELRLVETPAGLRLAQSVPVSIKMVFDKAPVDSGVSRSDAFLDARIGSTCTITLFGEPVPQFRLVRTSPATATLHVHRADRPGMNGFGHDYEVGLNCRPGQPLDIELYLDRGIVEIGAGGGATWVTSLYYPDDATAWPRIELS